MYNVSHYINNIALTCVKAMYMQEITISRYLFYEKLNPVV